MPEQRISEYLQQSIETYSFKTILFVPNKMYTSIYICLVISTVYFLFVTVTHTRNCQMYKEEKLVYPDFFENHYVTCDLWLMIYVVGTFIYKNIK